MSDTFSNAPFAPLILDALGVAYAAAHQPGEQLRLLGGRGRR